MLLLQVRSTSNNAKGNKRVICFRYSYDDTDFIIQTWNFIARSSTNERSKCDYHSLLCNDISFLVSNSSRQQCKRQTLGQEVMGMKLRRSHTELAGMYSSYAVPSRRDVRVCGRVQLRLLEALTSKPALFVNAKLVSSSSSLPQNLCGFPAYLL